MQEFCQHKINDMEQIIQQHEGREEELEAQIKIEEQKRSEYYEKELSTQKRSYEEKIA